MSIILTVAFALILFFGKDECEGRERRLYMSLASVAAVAAFLAGFAAKDDHVGASLSGMISIFMR